MHITCVVGARPNFIKMSAILHAAEARPELQTFLVHTGQHYDDRMSALFFEQLALPQPNVHLGVGSGSHAVQTAQVMLHFDQVLDEVETDLVVVVGDVNSTLACALVAVKRGIPVAHVEAGLRSRDRSMPEEINRVLTDQISDVLFTSEREAEANLLAEGIRGERIHFVGNVMIDTLYRHRQRACASTITTEIGVSERQYALSTLHRPSNVDTEAAALNTVRALEQVAQRLHVVIPMHPRTRARLRQFGLLERLEGWPSVRVLNPLGYLEFLALMDRAAVVLTDSGGVQEETTALGVPCLTFRNTTERPITITAGTNRLVGVEPDAVSAALDDLLSGRTRAGCVPELWDGHAGARTVEALVDWSRDRPPASGAQSAATSSASVRQVHSSTGSLRASTWPITDGRRSDGARPVLRP